LRFSEVHTFFSQAGMWKIRKQQGQITWFSPDGSAMFALSGSKPLLHGWMSISLLRPGTDTAIPKTVC
jgi:hypothetical protein